MRHRGHRIVKAGWAVVLGTAFLAGAGVRAVDPPLDLEARLGQPQLVPSTDLPLL